MQVHLTRSEVLGLLLEKLPTNLPFAIEEVVITDGCDEVAPASAIPLQELTKTEAPKPAGCLDVDYADQFVKRSGIVDILRSQLSAQGFSSRFPKDAEKLCTKAWETVIDTLDECDRQKVGKFVGDCDWVKFAEIWAKYQDEIRKKL